MCKTNCGGSSTLWLHLCVKMSRTRIGFKGFTAFTREPKKKEYETTTRERNTIQYRAQIWNNGYVSCVIVNLSEREQKHTTPPRNKTNHKYEVK